MSILRRGKKPDLQWGQIISVVATTFCATKIDNLSTDRGEPKEILDESVSYSDCGYGRDKFCMPIPLI